MSVVSTNRTAASVINFEEQLRFYLFFFCARVVIQSKNLSHFATVCKKSVQTTVFHYGNTVTNIASNCYTIAVTKNACKNSAAAIKSVA